MMTGRKELQLMAALEKKEAPEGCPLLACLGSPTWARTRDLRINSHWGVDFQRLPWTKEAMQIKHLGP